MRSNIPILFILLSGLSFTGYTNWKLEKNEDGITLYTRSYNASDIKAVRIVDTVKSSLSAIAAILLDTKNYPSWIYHCSEARTIKLINGQEQYKYVRTDIPWPFDDRDMVTDFKITQDSVTKIVRLVSLSSPDYIPQNSGVIRIRDYESVYTLTPLSNGYVLMEMEFHADPSGAIPMWLMNSNIVSGPFATAVAMRKKLSQYQSAQYSFIKERI